MKIFVAFVFLCIAGALAIELTEDEKKIINRHKNDCLKKSGLEEAVYEKAVEEKMYYFNEKMNCFTACMFKRMEIMSLDGIFDEDIVRALVGDRMKPDVLDSVLQSCKNEDGKDHCEKAGKISVCFMKNGDTL